MFFRKLLSSLFISVSLFSAVSARASSECGTEAILDPILLRLQNAAVALSYAKPSTYFEVDCRRVGFIAQASGYDSIEFSAAILFEFTSQDELAFFIAHELAHIIRKDTSSYAPKNDPQLFEREADRLGLRLLIQAGYSPSASISSLENFFAYVRRVASPLAGQGDEEHPSMNSRIEALRLQIKESVTQAEPSPTPLNPELLVKVLMALKR